jgi:hypothetical protein
MSQLAIRSVGALLIGGLLWVAPVSAKLCGDDVGGVDVPCGCGDVVVSSVALAGDPVTTEVCATDGLVVRAPDARRAVIVDLRAHTLRGAGKGTGVRFVAGGPGGAKLVSSGGVAQLVGFEDGIVARGPDSILLVEDVVIADSRRDGLRVTADDFEIRRVEVRDAGRDGFSLNGRAFQVAGTRATASGRFGYFVMGESAIIGLTDAANVAERSGQVGFTVMGAGHVLANCSARDGGKHGMQLQAVQLDVRNCQARANAGTGIIGSGSNWRLADNLAADNRGDGIAVRGPRLADEGGNRGERNGSALERPAVQCRIGRAPCVL